MLKQMTGLMIAGLLATGCATTTPNATTAIQRENNQYDVTGLGKSKTLALNNAVSAANKTCRNVSAVVTNQQVKYNGIGDEQTGRIIEQAAGIIGDITGTRTNNVSRDDDFEATLSFYCKS